MQLRGGVLQPQARAQNAGAALPPKNEPNAGGIHEPHPAKVYDQGTRAAADQCIVQLHPQALGGIVVDLARQIGIEQIVRRAEGHCRHILISFFLA